MSISQLELELSRLKIQLAAMSPASPGYHQVLAQVRHLTTARAGRRQGIQSLTF